MGQLLTDWVLTGGVLVLGWYVSYSACEWLHVRNSTDNNRDHIPWRGSLRQCQEIPGGGFVQKETLRFLFFPYRVGRGGVVLSCPCPKMGVVGA